MKLSKFSMKNSFKIVFLFASLFLITSCGSSAEATPDINISNDDVNEVASQLYCPICENVPLDVCPSTACADWRELIRKLMSEGRSDAEIKQYFADQYGWKVLSMPPRVGFNWLLYVLPPIIIIGGGTLVALSIRKKHGLPIDDVSSEHKKKNDVMDHFIDIIEKDLKENDHAD